MENSITKSTKDCRGHVTSVLVTVLDMTGIAHVQINLCRQVSREFFRIVYTAQMNRTIYFQHFK